MFSKDSFSGGIIGTNLLTKFHDHRTINVASRVLTKKNAPPRWPYIIETNPLTEFNEDWTINVVSRVHIFQANLTIFKLIQNINKTNLLTVFHEDWTINVASRVLTRKNALPPGGHVFKETKTIFELIQDIIGTNLLTKFHKDGKINVASRVLTRDYNSHKRKNAPPPGGHVFQPKGIIFELVQDNIGRNLLTKFHEDQTINVASRVKNAPPLGTHVFQAKVTIFELIQDIIGTNLLTKYHEDRKIKVASGAIYSHIRKNALPLGSNVFQANITIFELIQDIIETNLLTKFHEDWTINVASRELKRQNC
ncbi:hypothetical protein DPMN_148566 [Dreissena polymorpha]|uniref:Uncharacterized protein n=1 Tax=Dreissena polymorpha TaxID=45954 RepID=A0A9D4J0C0_DREPO|nr:hypothetical protein DPMN_148566 [Dreissena polymorpha]